MQADLGGSWTTNFRSVSDDPNNMMMLMGGGNNNNQQQQQQRRNNNNSNNDFFDEVGRGDEQDDGENSSNNNLIQQNNRPIFIRRDDAGNNLDNDDNNNNNHIISAETATRLFASFIIHFVVAGSEYIYLRALRDNLTNMMNYLEIDFQHIRQYSESLARAVEEAPIRTIAAMEQGASLVAVQNRMFSPRSTDQDVQIQIFTGGSIKAVPLRQLSTAGVAKLVCVSGIVVKASVAKPRCVKAMIQCTSCRQKMAIPGHRAHELPQQCQSNQGGGGGGGINVMDSGGGGGGQQPGRLNQQQKCRPNPYVLLPDQCVFDDQQTLKLQEPPDEVPTGELPRHVSIAVERYHVGRITPGMRIQVVGIVSVQDRRSGEKNRVGSSAPVAGLRSHFIRAVGLMHSNSRGGGGGGGSSNSTVTSINTSSFVASVAARGAGSWDVSDEAAFKSFARANAYDLVSRSIDPAIFGLHDPKKAIACLLFGGTRKRLDGNFLRGDINVLLIGDPSTAKSQLLKFTEQIAPIGLYTSGKGSSAAGLTASVVGGGQGGDFTLEAGSMVLADGGVVCIDEFDKMREQDQVAIHEAMEQQTISIAKANMTTMLNSRTSVLAAANPTLGSYDPLRSNEEQLDFQSSILSRFDLIFKVLDPKDPLIDTQLARHVVKLHKSASAADSFGKKGGDRAVAGQSAGGAVATSVAGGGLAGGSSGAGGASGTAGLFTSNASLLPTQISQHTNNNNNNNASSSSLSSTSDLPPLQFLTKYIAYARQTCFPTISEPAATALLDFFVKVRSESHRATQEALQSSNAVASTIQVTARQLESLVRITESLARMRLDPVANISDAAEAIRLFTASTVDAIKSGVVEQTLTDAQSALVIRIEEAIRNRLPAGTSVQAAKLMSELQRLEFDSKLVERALFAMTRREEIIWMKQRTIVQRNR